MPPTVAFYSHTAFMEPALSLVRALAEEAKVHLLLEVTPGSWERAFFDVPPQDLPEGLVPGDAVLAPFFPAAVREYWRAAESFHLVVHRHRRSLHPSSVRVSRRALRFVEEVGADVLHVDDVDVTPRLALALPFYRGAPVVVSVHDPAPHSGERNWRKRLGRWLAFPRAAGFVLYNERLRESFARSHRIPQSRVRSIRFGPYDLRAEAAGPPPAAAENRDHTILFFGRLSPYKGIEDLYAAIPSVAEVVRDLRVVVAGRPIEGYEPASPPALVPPASVERIERYLNNAETADLFRGASLVVCPYRDATQSGVVPTAYAFGVPVVATDVGALREYVIPGRTGLLVPARDPPALAGAILRFLNDPPLRHRLVQGVREESSGTLGWSAAAATLLSLYRELSDAG